MEIPETPENVALFFGTKIHRDWMDNKAVENWYRQLKMLCLKNAWDYSLVLKRVGDYMRECFDREPKMRDIPLEEATEDLAKWLRYVKDEM